MPLRLDVRAVKLRQEGDNAPAGERRGKVGLNARGEALIRGHAQKCGTGAGDTHGLRPALVRKAARLVGV